MIIQKIKKMVKRLSEKGFTDEEIAEDLDIPVEEVRKMGADIVIGIEDGHTTFLGQEKSSELYKHFTHKGYIDSRGKVQDLLRIDLKDNNVEMDGEPRNHPNGKSIYFFDPDGHNLEIHFPN